MVLVSGTYKDVLRKQFTSIEDHSKITSIKANTGVEFSGNFRYCFCYYYSTADDFTNLTSVDFTNVDTSAILLIFVLCFIIVKSLNQLS